MLLSLMYHFFIYACDALHKIIVRTQRNCNPGCYVVAKFIQKQLIKLNSFFLLLRVCGSGHSSLVALQPTATTEPNLIADFFGYSIHSSSANFAGFAFFKFSRDLIDVSPKAQMDGGLPTCETWWPYAASFYMQWIIYGKQL